jgi:hypothetical protein
LQDAQPRQIDDVWDWGFLRPSFHENNSVISVVLRRANKSSFKTIYSATITRINLIVGLIFPSDKKVFIVSTIKIHQIKETL